MLLNINLSCLIWTCTCVVCHYLQNLRSGTTALVGMVTDVHLYIGWTGDSQVILVRRGVPTFASQPHKPEREVNKRSSELPYICMYNYISTIYLLTGDECQFIKSILVTVCIKICIYGYTKFVKNGVPKP